VWKLSLRMICSSKYWGEVDRSQHRNQLRSTASNPAIKISDNIGKNTGNKATVRRAKKELGYEERRQETEDKTSPKLRLNFCD
jgi:hypothetical protein